MEITRTAKPRGKMADVSIWYCDNCQVVHMSIGGDVLNFTREEFAVFTESIVDIHCSAWSPNMIDSIIDLAENEMQTKGEIPGFVN